MPCFRFLSMVCVFKHLYCSAQLSMSNMEKRYRNKIIIIMKMWICVVSSVLPAVGPPIHKRQKLYCWTLHGTFWTSFFRTCSADWHYWLLPFFTTFTDPYLSSWSKGQCKATSLGLSLSCTFQLIRMEFDMVLHQIQLNTPMLLLNEI